MTDTVQEVESKYLKSLVNEHNNQTVYISEFLGNSKDAVKRMAADIKQQKAKRRYLDKGGFSNKETDARIKELREKITTMEDRRKSVKIQLRNAHIRKKLAIRMCETYGIDLVDLIPSEE